MALKKRDLEEGKTVISSSMTVSAWAYKAVDTYKTNQKEITRSKYVDRMRHCILEQIGSMPLKSVKPIHCQEILNRQAGKSKTQVNEVYQTLKFIFSTAYNNGLLAADPSAKIIKPSYVTGHRRAITDQERAALLQVAETDPRFNIFLLMLFCGCRPSEAMAAQGQDIQQIDGYPVLHIRGTKTANADRFVPIPEDFYQRIKKTPQWRNICLTRAGTPYNTLSYRRLFHRLRREMNIALGCRVYRNELMPPFPLAEDYEPVV